MKNLLIDCSLTGGRGPAKKVYELTTDLKQEKIPYKILSDKGFEPKLLDLGVKPDILIETNLNESHQKIMKKFYNTIKNVDYDYMLKIGARMAGPFASKKLGKPYIIADGGLPDYMTQKEGLYSADTFQRAEKYYVTTQFPWKPPNRLDLKNVDVCCYPIAKKTFEYIDNLKKMSRNEIIKQIENKINGSKPDEDELLIDLVITGDYVQSKNRVTYGAWLEARQYDMMVGYLRRLLTDLGNLNEKATIFLDNDLLEVVLDITKKFSNLHYITYRRDWDYSVELAMKAASDVTISRATNYQPYIAALAKGCNVTTPVPADGYMDEDSAAIQYEALGFTKHIKYDDENYCKKLLKFIDERDQHKEIKNRLEKNRFIIDRNLNIIIKQWIAHAQT